MGPIPYSFTYEATVAPDPEALRVVMEFNVRKAVHTPRTSACGEREMRPSSRRR